MGREHASDVRATASGGVALRGQGEDEGPELALGPVGAVGVGPSHLL